MDDLLKQAEELGLKVDKRWSADTLRQKIDEALGSDADTDVDTDAGADHPKTLHELNQEQWAIDEANGGYGDRGRHARRVQKMLRAPVK